MKLFHNPPSPYGRKVLVTAHEKGVLDRLEIAPVDPWQDPPDLLTATPLAKVPALVTPDGSLIPESTAICGYLDGLEPATRLTGNDPLLLARVGLAQGLIDAAFALVLEGQRPAGKRWQPWIDRQSRALERTLRAVAAVDPERFDLGDISLACALAYLEFRLPEIGWREPRPDLAGWLDGVKRRPSMRATEP